MVLACIKITQVFILSTLGLFDFSVVQVPNNNQYKLTETGSSQRHLSKFEAIGFVNILTSSKLRPFYMYQEDNGVKRYIKVGDSSTDYRLSVTTNYDERSTFLAKSRDSIGTLYTVMYKDPSSGDTLYLQGVFPLVNGTVNHTQAYARVGYRSAHYNISGNIVPLSAIASSNTCGQKAKLLKASKKLYDC